MFTACWYHWHVFCCCCCWVTPIWLRVRPIHCKVGLTVDSTSWQGAGTFRSNFFQFIACWYHWHVFCATWDCRNQTKVQLAVMVNKKHCYSSLHAYCTCICFHYYCFVFHSVYLVSECHYHIKCIALYHISDIPPEASIDTVPSQEEDTEILSFHCHILVSFEFWSNNLYLP